MKASEVCCNTSENKQHKIKEHCTQVRGRIKRSTKEYLDKILLIIVVS